MKQRRVLSWRRRRLHVMNGKFIDMSLYVLITTDSYNAFVVMILSDIYYSLSDFASN